MTTGSISQYSDVCTYVDDNGRTGNMSPKLCSTSRLQQYFRGRLMWKVYALNNLRSKAQIIKFKILHHSGHGSFKCFLGVNNAYMEVSVLVHHQVLTTLSTVKF